MELYIIWNNSEEIMMEIFGEKNSNMLGLPQDFTTALILSNMDFNDFKHYFFYQSGSNFSE